MQYLQKNIGDEVVFLPADKRKNFVQDGSITLGVIAKHTQSTQNNKFGLSLQYLKESMRDEVDFFLADKRQRFLQISLSNSRRYMAISHGKKVAGIGFVWHPST